MNFKHELKPVASFEEYSDRWWYDFNGNINIPIFSRHLHNRQEIWDVLYTAPFLLSGTIHGLRMCTILASSLDAMLHPLRDLDSLTPPPLAKHK